MGYTGKIGLEGFVRDRSMVFEAATDADAEIVAAGAETVAAGAETADDGW